MRVDVDAADAASRWSILRASGNPSMQAIAALIGTALSAAFAPSTPAIVVHLPGQARRDAMTALIRQGWTTSSGFVSTELVQLGVPAFPRE